ncbi:MAG: methyltransferase domain-containing protein [Chloroflexi bacterium]|nr:methyltransferase domain-containing protein [Chloroflexota bacterium]
MDEYLKANRQLWDAWTQIHVKSSFYDVDGFKAGRSTLDSVVRSALGDVRGKSLLHLQCHFGMDTLSWARLGARVTGADFSEQAINAARELSAQVGLDANFVCANIYDLPGVLSGEFDIVFTSYGVLYWLPDLQKWAQVAAHFLKPGGTFFIADGHPFAMVFENEGEVTDLQPRYPYFHADEPMRWETHGSYAEPLADVHNVEYGWQHSMSDVLKSLLAAGLQIQELREYPFARWQMFPFMERDAEGWWRLPERFVQIPLIFSLTAKKQVPTSSPTLLRNS